MKFSAAVILAAAIGASAHPSHHAHRHAHAQRSAVGAREFVMAKKPVPAPTTTSSPPPPPPPATATPKPAPPVANAAAIVDTPSSSKASPSSGGGKKPFCNGVSKRATVAEIGYVGNVGAPDQFGCNIMEIDSNTASDYEYTIKFVNMGNQKQQCKLWNKIGRTGKVNGFFTGNEAMTFELAGNGQQTVAVEGNSQIGGACYPGSVPLTIYGQFASTWFEADFGNTSNQKYSGFDASCLVAAASGLDIPGLEVCGKDICSTINKGGSGTNAYLAGMEALDGVGGNLGPGPAALTVKVDY